MKLTPEEEKLFVQTYGRQFDNDKSYGIKTVEDIRELTENERRFFDKKNFLSPNFFTQTLYKFSGEILPLKFNLAIHKLVEREEMFRTNFFNTGSRVVKVIFRNRPELPEITYRSLKHLDADDMDETLTKIMEADRRESFDLKNDYLIRFAIFGTGENEFAILITMSMLIAESFDEKNFFRYIGETGEYKSKETVSSMTGKSTVPAKKYWENILKDLPEIPAIPGEKNSAGLYKPAVFRQKIPADIVSDLRNYAQQNKLMLMSVLQTAWAFLLKSVNFSDDLIFCRLISNQKSKEDFSVNMIPVRVKIPPEMTIDKIIKEQFKQLIISQPYSFFDWSELSDSDLPRKYLSNHFLSFVDFSDELVPYSLTWATEDGAIVGKNFWETRGMKLSVYFQYTNRSLSVTFNYDSSKFSVQAGELIAKFYNTVLRQMLVYLHSDAATFNEHIKEKIASDVPKITNAESERKIFADFISTCKIFQTADVGIIEDAIAKMKLMYCFEGDRIHGDLLNENLVFVIDGKLSRSLSAGDGDFYPLDIIKKGGWMNETIFLEKKRTEISGEVLTDFATLAYISEKDFRTLARKYPSVSELVFQHILKQEEKYQLLWIQS